MSHHPQDLINILISIAEDLSGNEDEIIAGNIIDAVDRYRAHSTPAPDVSDADLLDIWIEAKTQSKGTQYATDLAAIHAVRQALASSGAAVDMPENVNRIHGARKDGKWRVTLDNFLNPILSSLDGTGPTLAAAIADASQEGEG